MGRFLLRNTYLDDPSAQWTAWPTRGAAISAAQELIDAGGAGDWMWIEDGQEITFARKAEDGPPPWSLTIFDGLEEAMDAVTFLPPATWPAHRAAIVAAESGKEPDPPAPRKRRKRR